MYEIVKVYFYKDLKYPFVDKSWSGICIDDKAKLGRGDVTSTSLEEQYFR